MSTTIDETMNNAPSPVESIADDASSDKKEFDSTALKSTLAPSTPTTTRWEL